MTKLDSSRTQSSQAQTHNEKASLRRHALQAKSGGDMSSSGFAARSQAAGDQWTTRNTGDGGSSSKPSCDTTEHGGHGGVGANGK